jgi:DNA-binding transcriptional MerR regulator
MAKGPEAFRTISEAAEEVGVAQHVLRFWETKFSFIRPMKRAGGRRFYRPQDLAVLCGVRRLLHEDGYTIAGVQRLHREHGLGRLLKVDAPPRKGADGEDATALSTSDQAGGLRDRLAATLRALEEAKARLDEVLEG